MLPYPAPEASSPIYPGKSSGGQPENHAARDRQAGENDTYFPLSNLLICFMRPEPHPWIMFCNIIVF